VGLKDWLDGDGLKRQAHYFIVKQILKSQKSRFRHYGTGEKAPILSLLIKLNVNEWWCESTKWDLKYQLGYSEPR
jgi:hypothetical protein